MPDVCVGIPLTNTHVTHTQLLPLHSSHTPPSFLTFSWCVQLVAENMKGENSPKRFYRRFVGIHSDVFHYQCSKFSTSNEIRSVFERAIERQRRHQQVGVAKGVGGRGWFLASLLE